LRKELKQPINCLQRNDKKLLKQRLDFPCDKRIETTDRLPAIQGQNIVETTVCIDFPFEKKEIKTTDRLPTMQSTKSVKTTVRFSILERI